MRRRLLFLPLLLLAFFSAGLGAARAVTPTTGDVRGTVQDSRGRPVPNVTVRVQIGPVLQSARTDLQGQYVLADLAPGVYELLALKPGYNSVLRRSVEVAAAVQVTVDFELSWANRDAGALELFVQDSDRTPLPEASVDLLVNSTVISSGATDDHASIVFTGLARRSYDLSVRRPGYLARSVRGLRVRTGGMTTATVRLVRDRGQVGRITGEVRDTGGSRIAGAAVRIVAGLSGGDSVTRPDGTFTLNDLIPGSSYSLQVSARDYQTLNTGGIAVREGQTTPLSITLVPRAPQQGSLSGVVTDPNGQASPFATVTVTAGPEQGEAVQADAAGRYLFPELRPSGGYAVVARQTGFSPAGASGIRVEAGRTTVLDLQLGRRLQPPGSVSGFVRERGSSRILAGVQVQIAGGPSAGLTGSTNEFGHYEIEEVTPAEGYSVQFSKAGYAPNAVFLVTVRSGIPARVDADLAPRQGGTGRLAGKVRRFGGGVVSGARVRVASGPTAPLETLTNSTGDYSFQSLPGTDYTVRVEKSGFVTQTRTRVAVRDGEEVRVDFSLQRPSDLGSIRGLVTNLLSEPVVGASVRVLEGPMIPVPAITDSRGEFLMEELRPGTYRLQVTANGLATQEKGGIVVPRRRATRVVFRMSRI
jgi:large repetitive protein